MKKLEETGLADSTIIVLWGDHGYHLGDQNQWGKHTNFEQAVRAPLIIFKPGNIPVAYPYPVEFLDIYPTLCDLTDLEIPVLTQGKSLAGILEGNNEKVKAVAVSEYRSGGHSSYSFRTERYRLILWFDKSTMRPDVEDWDAKRIFKEELYDYDKDSLETAILADVPASRQSY